MLRCNGAPTSSRFIAAATATEAPLNFVRLTATFGGNTPIRDGISWRVFSEQAAPDGSRKVVATSSEPVARFNLADGDYIVHAAYGLAGVTKKISVRGGGVARAARVSRTGPAGPSALARAPARQPPAPPNHADACVPCV